MNKKATYNTVKALFVIALVAVLFIAFYTGNVSNISAQAKEIFNIDKVLPNNTYDPADDLPADILNYASQLAHQLFDENYGGTTTVTAQGEGELLLVEKRTFDNKYVIGFEKNDPALPLHMYIGTLDGKKHLYYMHDIKGSDFDFIHDYDVCVLPLSKYDARGAFALHYATEIDFHKSLQNTFAISRSNQDALMNGVIKQDLFFVTEEKPELRFLVNGKVERETLATKNTEGIVALRYNKKVCFLPIGGDVRLFTPRRGDEDDTVIRGKGFLEEDIIEDLLEKELIEKKW